MQPRGVRTQASRLQVGGDRSDGPTVDSHLDLNLSARTDIEPGNNDTDTATTISPTSVLAPTTSNRPTYEIFTLDVEISDERFERRPAAASPKRSDRKDYSTIACAHSLVTQRCQVLQRRRQELRSP